MSSTLDASGKRIQRQAAAWLALRQARGLTTAEHASFAEWRTSNPRHAQIFAAVEATWSALDGLTRYPHSVDLAADPDLLLQPRSKPRRFTFPRLALAAAAAIAISVALLWKPWAETSRRPSPTSVATESRVMHLPDGSVVELNIGAQVEAAFAPAERRVRLLAGEAHFTVAKDPARPFLVEAKNVAVRAVGTAFDVRLAGAAVEVLVTEGTVHVQRPAESSNLGPEPSAVLTEGQKTVVSTLPQAAAPVVEKVSSTVVDQTLAWQSSRFIFDAMPLSEVIDRLNHSAAKTILVLDDPQLATLKFSGRVRVTKVDSLVEVLETSFGVAAERRGDGRIILRKAR